ncbi:hypothetical protein [Ilumatobacter sp.]
MVTILWIICGLLLVVSAAVRLRSPNADRVKPAVLAVAGVGLIVIGLLI